MKSKTKIIVLRLKELIYTGLFLLLAIVFIIILAGMFSNKENTPRSEETVASPNDEIREGAYLPGVYSVAIPLGAQNVSIDVTVDSSHINEVRLNGITEDIETMYPLLAPSFEVIAKQLYEVQNTSDIVYADDQKYTSLVILDAIDSALETAKSTVSSNNSSAALPPEDSTIREE